LNFKEWKNLIIITADDLSYGSLGYQGCSIKNITPNLDALCKNSINFENAHTVVSLCQPSRSVLSTGLYPWNNGATGFGPVFEKVTTIVEILRNNGYCCSIIGKESHYQPESKFPWDYQHSKFAIEKNNSIYFDFISKILKNKKQPFFISCNFNYPHRPFCESIYKPEDVSVPQFLTDNIQTRIDLSNYYSSVNSLDLGVGMILELLKSNSVIDETLLVFTSDHGFSFPFVKANCYYHSTKVPLIFHGKNLTPKNFNENISSIDFMPTVLEMLGIDHDLKLDGSSYYNEIKKRKIKQKKIISCLHENVNGDRLQIRSLITDTYNYLFNFNVNNFNCEGSRPGYPSFDNLELCKKNKIRNRNKEEIYNYKLDPYCLNDLSYNVSLKKELRIELFNILCNYKDKIVFKIF